MLNVSVFFRAELEGLVIAAEVGAKGLYYELVIGTLGKPGDGYAAENAGGFDMDGKRTAVRGKVGGGVAALFEGLAFELQVEAHAVRAAMIARDDIAFAANPLGVIWGGAFERGVEERLVEAAHVNDDCQAPLHSHGAQPRADLPGYFGIEAREAEFALLPSYAIQVFGNAHGVQLTANSRQFAVTVHSS